MIYVITLIKGLLIGFLASVPLGPIGILCVHRTLSKGRMHGFVSGLGAATVDTLFASAAGFGFAFIVDFIHDQKKILQLIGGFLILAIGIKTFYSHSKKEILEKKQPDSLPRDFITTFILTMYNPLTFFAFLAIFTGFGLLGSDKGYFFHTILVVGVFIGASLWWFTLTSLVSLYRKSFSIKNIFWINKISGVALFVFGLYYSVYSIVELFFKQA